MLFSLNQRIGADSDWASCSIQGYHRQAQWRRGVTRSKPTGRSTRSAPRERQCRKPGWPQIGRAAVSGVSGTQATSHTPPTLAIRLASSTRYRAAAGLRKIGASTDMGGRFWFFVVEWAAIAIDAGKLYRLDGDTPTQIGSATNWASIGPSFAGFALAYRRRRIHTPSRREGLTTATQIGAATNWAAVSGGQSGTVGDVHAYALNTVRRALQIAGATATRGSVLATNWSELAGMLYFTFAYARNTSGELYRI